jgi:coenzyme F420-reducing hydrogenase gamma subunit
MKKTLAIFSMTCCEGCEFEMLNHYEEFAKLLPYYDIKNFRLGQEDNVPGPFDVSIIEGCPDGDRQRRFVRKIRGESGIVIGLGACAHLGGFQSQRNKIPQKLIHGEPIKTLRDVIKVDYIVPGCPSIHDELYKCLLDIYWGKTFTLPDQAVCFECRQNGNECHLKNGRPCLGPVTRGGCNSVCINNGEVCLGCRGATPRANFAKIKEILGGIISEEEVENMLTFYGDYELENKKEQGLA